MAGGTAKDQPDFWVLESTTVQMLPIADKNCLALSRLKMGASIRADVSNIWSICEGNGPAQSSEKWLHWPL